MNKKLYQLSIPILLFVAMLSVSSCVNKDYKIDGDKIDTGVHLAPNGINIPLATIDRKMLKDIINDQDNLIADGDGYYALRYEDRFDFNVDGINMPSIGNIGDAFGDMTFDLDIADFDFADETNIKPIALQSNVVFPDGMFSNINILGGETFNGHFDSNNGKVEIDVAVPKEIHRINKVWFAEKGTGTPITMKINANGMGSVVDILTVNSFTVTLPEYYVLKAGTYSGATVTGDGTNKLTISNYILPSTREIVFYIESLDLSGIAPVLEGVDYVIKESKSFIYSVNYTVRTKSGMTGSAPPQAVITGMPVFADATFTTNPIIIAESNSEPLAYRVGVIPSMVEKIAGIEFKNGNMTISIDDFASPFDTEPNLKITFPSIFSLTNNGSGTLSGNTLTAPITAFKNGYPLTINSLTLLGEEGVPDTDGYIDLKNHNIKTEINHTFASQQMTWSTDIENLTLPTEITVDISLPGIQIKTISAELNISLDSELAGKIDPIDLSSITNELPEGDFTPDLVAPTITIAITNPVGLTIEGDLVLDPKKNDISLGNININNLIINPSEDGSAKTTYIFIAEQGVTTPEGYEKYTAPLGNLVETIPSVIDISLSAKTKTNTVYTVPVDQDFLFSMNYSVDMPLAFGENMDITIDIKEDGLTDIFSDLAESKIKAADISVSIELEVTFPLKVENVTVELTDKDGNTIPGLVTTIIGILEGPKPEAGGTKKSTLTIGLNAPNGGDFQTLSTIDILKLKLPISGTGNVNRLRPDDYISGKAWITLAKGISINLD